MTFWNAMDSSQSHSGQQIAFSAVLKGGDVAESIFLRYFFEYSCFAGKLKW